MARENDADGESAFKALKRGGCRLLRRHALIEIIGDEMRDGFRIGFRTEAMLLFLEFFAQFAVIFDDAVMHQRHLLGHMRVSIILVRPAMSPSAYGRC